MASQSNSQNDFLTQREAALFLGISEATIRNWIKAKLVTCSQRQKEKVFKSSELASLKKKIESGELRRLQSRANKKYSPSQYSHRELLFAKKSRDDIEKLLFDTSGKIEDILYCCYLVMLEQSAIKITSKIKLELSHWNISTSIKKQNDLQEKLKALHLDNEQSLLSYLYQRLTLVSQKSTLGAYYTSSSLVQQTVLAVIKKNQTFLDPCCGSGHFVVEAYRTLKKKGSSRAHELVFGVDIDPIAVLVARANLTLATLGSADSVAQIKKANALLDFPFKKQFNSLSTNPPWGAHFSKQELKLVSQKFPHIKSQESFSYFISLFHSLLAPNSQLTIILPESIATVALHRDIRKFILCHFKVVAITSKEHRFSGVFTPSMTLHLKKHDGLNPETLQINGQEYDYQILCSKGGVWPIKVSPEEFLILKRIERSPKLYLKDNAQWGLGIVTGNNKHFLKITKKSGYETILAGTDIHRFRISIAKRYIKYNPRRLQQAAPLELYRVSKKMVYRFICKELVFAIDSSQSLTLNSANVLIPSLPGYSLKALCALFNSKLGQFYYQKKFNSIKTLRQNLEAFPLVVLKQKELVKIEEFVTRIEKKFDPELFDELNEYLMKIYGLSKSQRQIIRNLKLSSQFN